MDADRERRDAAGIGPYARERQRLVALSTLDTWQVSKGEPDIRGWEIRTISGRQLGVVRDLLIDREAGEAVLIDVDLPGTDQHAEVPIRSAHIDRAGRVVIMDSAELDAVTEPTQVAGAPRATIPPAGEVVVDRAPVVEDSSTRPREAAAAAEQSAEPRRGDRRHIDRPGTDL